MVSVEELRTLALSFPETAEGTHFKLTAFEVGGKAFVTIAKDNRYALVRLNKEDIHELVTKDPDVFEEMWQMGKYLIGVRIDLNKVSMKELRHAVTSAWLFRAPKKLASTFKTSSK
jgi:hypothetical protein